MGGWAPHLVAGICVLVLALTVSHADEVNHCSAAKITSCSDCLQIGAGCAYCPDELFEHHRCDLTENLENNKCIQVITVQSSAQIKENVQINEKLNQSQVAPQLMQMSLLPGEEKEVEMEVFAPTLGPLDLYILMDFSNSMSDDLDNLKRMGDQLAQLVGKISNDYTIGFGKFVDKVTDPQTDMRPAKLAQPWPNSDPPFSFRNVITLTNNITYFRQKLQKERISGNLDAPEGGFDAILQTAVCQKQIGWRQYSTHLLVFSTESAFHYEADGANVLAGILDRNDEQCHLSSDGSYTHDTLQDYPSIPTLVRLLVQHNIIPIFAITNYSYSYYEKLHEYFPIAELGQLQEDSANILSILEKAFENIVSKISIRAEDKPKAFNVQILSQSGTSSEFSDFKITPGEIGKFKVRLRALNKVGDQYVCKGNEADRTGTLRIKPTTFSSAFRINAEVLCPRCDCEKTPVRNAARCGGHGDLVCGKCQCNKGWLGPFCNCSEGASTDTSMCVAPNTSEPCMGRGDCLCGTCMCSNPLYEGNYCQFDKSQCQRFGGFLCNDRGSCSLGRCVCMPGWTGEACECPISNQTCLDSKGGICNGRGVCRCGRCDCQHSGLPLSPTCESNFQAQLGMCEDKRSCVQCQAWNTGERKGKNCDNCHFTSVLVEDLSEDEDVIESCSFRDEDDDCNYYYTVNYPVNETDTQHRVLVKKKKDCPPAGFLWLIPLIMFLILLLGLLLLCCWKYCGCCQACLALLPCCARGRMVGFKEDQYLLSTHSLFTSDHLDTPMVRTGPLKNSDIVHWKVTDNVHRGLNHPQNQIKPNLKENIEMPVSLRLNQQYSETFSRPEAQDTDVLRQEVEENLNNVFLQIPGAQRVRQTRFRIQRNSGKRLNNTIVDTVLAAPRASFPDIVKLTDKQVQTGKFRDLKIVPGYYTVATDREAEGAVEFPDDVESVDVRVPLFIKDDDDDKKELLVQAVDVPVGSAKIGKDHVNITVIKEQARSIFSFLEPSYTFSRQEGVVNIPISREIIEDGRTQVTFSSRDLTAKDRKDYLSVQGDLSYGPGETVKPVPVKLLELGESDGLLENKQVKQFVMDLSNPRQGAKLGRYPCTTVTIADKPEPSVVMFKTNTQTFSTADPVYTIPVTRSRNQEGPATVHWRTSKASRFDLSSSVNFSPGETEKNIFIQSGAYPSPIVPETFQLELFEPSDNAIIGERKTTLLNISDARGDWKHPDIQTRGFVSPTATSPGGRLNAPSNITAVPTGPQNIKLNWTPSDKAIGYKVKYWIYGDPELKAQVLDVKTPNAELTDLYAYCDYEMQVYAYNTLGEGDHSDIIPCQTPEDVPGRPGRLVFNVISPTVTQVSWAEPAKPNGVITSYEVNYTPINEEDKKPMGDSKKVMMNKRMLLIENLQPSQAYCYKVRASTKVGWGPYRDATINLATQPIRPMSTLIIPDIPIEDAEAEEEYDSHQMYSSEVLRSPTSSLRPSVSDLSQDQFSNGKWEQNFQFSGGSGSSSRNLSSASSTSYSHSTPRQAGINQSSTTYISGASSSQRFDMSGGQLREDVTMRKRSENRHYTDNDGVRDSIIMGNMSGGILDNLGVSSFSQSTTTSYSSSSRTRTQTDDINEALLDLDSVLHESRLHPGVPETPSRLVFSAMGTTALKLSWHEPRCETDILSYCVLYQMISGGEIRQIDVNNPAQHSVVVQDLLPNQSYVFKVKAKSREGWGPERKGEITIESLVDPKSPQSPVPGSPFTLSNPSAPGPLNFTALSPDTLQLSWEKPRKPSGDILGYVVTCEQPHGREDLRTFQVSGNAATSLNVSDLRKNMPYKFKVIAQTTQGFGPEREGIMTIESQEEGSMSQYSGQSVMKREVFNMPTEVTSQSFFTEPVVSSDGMMMSSRQMTASSSSVTRRQVEVVQRSVMSSSSVAKRLERQYYEA